VLTIVAAMGLRTMLLRENAWRNGLRHSQEESATASTTAVGLWKNKKGDYEFHHAILTALRVIVEEKTDKQDVSFRYTL
jgi:hypothetical protein